MELLQITETDDTDYEELIASILRQRSNHSRKEEVSAKEQEQRTTLNKQEEYDRKLMAAKTRLYQLFLYYCR